MKKCISFLSIIVLSLTMFSCANNKEFTIDNKQVVVEPYGWINSQEAVNDSIDYRLSTGNIALSIIFSESVIVPIYLTGTALYEPISKK